MVWCVIYVERLTIIHLCVLFTLDVIATGVISFVNSVSFEAIEIHYLR